MVHASPHNCTEAESLTKLCLTPKHCRISASSPASFQLLPSPTSNSHPDFSNVSVSAPHFPSLLGPLPLLRSPKPSLLYLTLLTTGLPEALYSHALQNRAFSWLFSVCLCLLLVVFSPSHSINIGDPQILTFAFLLYSRLHLFYPLSFCLQFRY